MFFLQMKIYASNVTSVVGMRILCNYYHCEKHISKNNTNNTLTKHGNKTFPYPFCMDCIHFVPMEHSSLFPNSGCSLFKPLKPCLNTRSDKELCGMEGKYFQKR